MLNQHHVPPVKSLAAYGEKGLDLLEASLRSSNVSATLKSPEADVIACPRIAIYDDLKVLVTTYSERYRPYGDVSLEGGSVW